MAQWGAVRLPKILVLTLDDFVSAQLVTKWVPGLPVPAECNHFHYEGCELFPNNLTKYTAYIHDFAEALVRRYGLAEVSQWYFEVYNEAYMHWPFLHYGPSSTTTILGCFQASPQRDTPHVKPPARARTAAPHCGSHCRQLRVGLTLQFL